MADFAIFQNVSDFVLVKWHRIAETLNKCNMRSLRCDKCNTAPPSKNAASANIKYSRYFH